MSDQPQPSPEPAAGPANPLDRAPALSPEVAAELAALQQLRAEMEAERAQMAADKAATAAALAVAQQQVTSKVRRPPKGERANRPGEYDPDGEFVFHAGSHVWEDAVEGSGKGDGIYGTFVHADAGTSCAACDAEAAAKVA